MTILWKANEKNDCVIDTNSK